MAKRKKIIEVIRWEWNTTTETVYIGRNRRPIDRARLNKIKKVVRLECGHVVRVGESATTYGLCDKCK